MGDLLSSLSELTSGNVTDATLVYADKSSADYKVQMSSVWTYISGKLTTSPTFVSVNLHGTTGTGFDIQYTGKWSNAAIVGGSGNLKIFGNWTTGDTNSDAAKPTWGVRWDVNSDKFEILRFAAGTSSDSGTGQKLVIDASGNVCIGGGTAGGTSAVSVLVFKNGTAPSSSPADSVQLYAVDVSSSSELRVRDEAGNVTTLSPHNFEIFEPAEDDPFPWSYRSENEYLGKIINVNMSGAIRALEKLTGEQFIFYADIEKQDFEKSNAAMLAKELASVQQDDDNKTARTSAIETAYSNRELPEWIQKRLIVPEPISEEPIKGDPVEEPNGEPKEGPGWI